MPGTILGVSSAINLSHDHGYETFKEVKYADPYGTLEQGKWAPTPSDMGLGSNTLQSIRKGWTNQMAFWQYFALDLYSFFSKYKLNMSVVLNACSYC